MKKLTNWEAKVIICEMIEAIFRIESYLKTKNKPMISDEQLKTALDLAIKAGKD
jgi:hypothetical protein